MPRPRPWSLLLALLAFAAMAAEPHPPATEREREAGQQLAAIEADLTQARALEPAERRAQELRMERALERAVGKADGTRHGNKALFLLASWRMSYADGEGVDDLLTRIETGGYAAYQQAAKHLRARWLLRKGRIAEARAIATDLAARVPEFAGLLDLCAFHEQIGAAPGRTAGTPLGESPADPAGRPEPWLVYHFTATLAGDDGWLVQQWLDELARPEYAGKARLVCVISAANPLTATGELLAMPGATAADLLWANPGEGGDAAAWRAAWKLPDLPATVLLGPQRTILAIQPVPADLRPLVGRPKAAPAGPAPGGGRGGRPAWSK
jgi:hypothetical protein